MLENWFATMFNSEVTNWIVLGLVLALLELVMPGVYLIWFGFAAFAVSILIYYVPMVFTTQLMWFAAFSAIFALAGWLTYQQIFKRTQTPKEYRHLNDSAAQHVGATVSLTEDCVNNQTKVQIGDTYWLAYCEKPLKKGDSAKVVGVKENLILIIE